MVARIIFVILAVVTFALDRVTKLAIEQQLVLGERIEVGGGVLELRRVHNSGIAFGLFSEAGFVVVAGSLLVGALLFWFLLHVEPGDWLGVVGGALITGGAIGNLVDRIQHGYVTDFLHVPSIGAFQTFNVADVGIVGGVALVVLSQLLAIRAERRVARHEEGPNRED